MKQQLNVSHQFRLIDRNQIHSVGFSNIISYSIECDADDDLRSTGTSKGKDERAHWCSVFFIFVIPLKHANISCTKPVCNITISHPQGVKYNAIYDMTWLYTEYKCDSCISLSYYDHYNNPIVHNKWCPIRDMRARKTSRTHTQ